MITKILVILLVVGISYAYADTQDTIIIPFDFNSRVCALLDSGNFLCEYDPKILDLEDVMANGTDNIPNPTEASTIIPEDKPLITIPENIITPPKPTKHEIALEQFMKNPPTSAADTEYFELLKNLAECQRGYAESKGTATNNWFPISYTWVNDGEAWLKSLEYKGQFGDLKKGIEECMAIRTILNPVILGPEYYNRGQYFGQTQTYHSDIATGVPIWSQNRVNQEANQGFTNPEQCDFADIYSDQTRKYFGCYEAPEGDAINPKGYIEYSNDMEDKWLQYLEDGGKQQTKELMKKIMEEKARDLRESLKQQAIQYGE